MPSWLKQSTAVDIGVGPFLDETDGKTAETALTITQPDIRLKKNGGAWAQKNAAQTLSHEEAGWYEVSLDTTDTNTLGILIVAIHESGALPVWKEYMVVPANAYDSLVAGSATLSSSPVAADIRSAVGLASANLDTQLDAIPTATENADALLNRNMASVADTNARSPLNALRFLRNKWSLSGTTLTVTEEDDVTPAWTAVVTSSPGADPISGSDPA